MSYKKSSQQYVCRRTSHYYKKKLSTKEQQISKDKNNDQTTKRVGNRIQKKPKQAKLRAKQARQRKKKYIERLQDKIQLLEKQLQKYRHSTAQHIQTKTIQSQNSAFINLNNSNNNDNNNNNNNTIKINSNINTHHNNNNNKSKQTQISQTNIAITTTNQKHKNIHNQQQQHTQFTEQIVKLQGIQHAFRKLYKAVFQRNQDQATNSVNILRERFGVAGEERKNWIKELILKIVDIQMPLHCRLLLEHCQNRQQFYKLLGGSESLKQFRKVYFDQSTISTICQSRSTMMEIKQQYKRILLNLQQLSYEICQQASKLQQQINRLQSSMNPLFVGRILVYLDMQRKQTQNLQEIFPVNFYKKSLLQCVHYRETMKYECDVEMCKQREEDRLERLEMLSQEENFLKDFFSD